MARDLTQILPANWGSFSATDKINWFNTVGATNEELAAGGVPAGDIAWMQSNGFVPGGVSNNANQTAISLPANVGSMDMAGKQAVYQDLISQGYTDQQIRNIADQQFGIQTNEAWNFLTGRGGNVTGGNNTVVGGGGNDTVVGGGGGGGGLPAISFPANIASMSQADKMSFYNSLLSRGYTDAQIRSAANAQFGVQTDEAWNYLTGRGGNVTNTTTTVTPPPTTQLSTIAAPLTQGAGESRIDPTIAPYLKEGLSVARGLFLNQPGPQLYPGQMYVSPSQQTLSALSAQEAIASSPNAALIGSQGAFLQGLNAPTYGQENLQNLYSLGATQPGLSAYQRAMQGAFTPETAGLEGVAQGFGNVAAGQFLTGSPYQQQLIEQSTRPIREQFLEQTLPALQSQFSRAGRYGSGAQERAIGAATESAARAIGDIATQIGQQTYTQERGFQEAARGAQANVLGQVAGLQQQGFGNILAGAQGLQGAQAQQFGQQFGAAQALAGAQQQALQTRLGTAAQAPQFYAQQFLPSQALAQVGAQREAIAGQPLQEAITRYNYAQQLPYQQLGGYLSSVYGSPLGSLTAMPQQQGNSFLSNLGAGVNILGTAASLFPQTTSQATNWISGLLTGK